MMAVPETTMRAVVVDGFGGPERLHVARMDVPRPNANEVLVRVIAAGVGQWDAKQYRGSLGPQPFPYVAGWEAAGIVEAIGEAVGDLAAGDAVFTYRFPGGAWAEYLATPAAATARKPASFGFGEAAGLPVVGVTAHQGVTEELALQQGETLLITGAAGGVGSVATQLAARLGVRVIGTASPRNHAYLRSLGALETVDYAGDWVATILALQPGGVDAVLDCVGGETLRRSYEAVRDGGRVAGIVDPSPPAAPRGIRSHYFAGAADAARLRALAALVDAGQLTIRIGEVFSLDHVREAATWVEAGHGRGLTILAVDGTTGGR
jgi:NADPH:quinone reductase-like Zn-dependent oxidoreductase